MRNRFVSKFGKPTATLAKLSESSKLGKDKLSDVEKLFEFARKRYAAPEGMEVPKDVPYTFQPGRRPDALSTGALKTELDAANFAIKEIRSLAAEARETFNKRRLVERTGEARDAVRHAVETEAFDAPTGPDMDAAPGPRPDESDSASRRRRRRVGGLFRRR